MNTLSQNSHVLNKFDLIDIAHNKPPQYITAVPSLLIPKENGEADMLVGRSVFEWLTSVLRSNQQQQQQHNVSSNNGNASAPIGNQNNPQGILDFDPCTMNGFSDNFSFLGNDNDKPSPIDHNFSFINSNNDKLINPNQFQDNGQSGGTKMKSDMERAYEHLVSSRDKDVPNAIQRS